MGRRGSSWPRSHREPLSRTSHPHPWERRHVSTSRMHLTLHAHPLPWPQAPEQPVPCSPASPISTQQPGEVRARPPSAPAPQELRVRVPQEKPRPVGTYRAFRACPPSRRQPPPAPSRASCPQHSRMLLPQDPCTGRALPGPCSAQMHTGLTMSWPGSPSSAVPDPPDFALLLFLLFCG